ncbi:DNA-binding transcriptional regulator YbjK [Amycolatopsis arida]|uniref:DNA-binding transcriptional regulator YbjK n=1 Tax=Amycolatopsis arida TaxID=587909 RepID=A0A1I5LH22_9PSEU|nr:TetR family transcriptional regulator [Amycolatopsis arida]TDX93720.1 DNA-binding transcriptional regulator YbjK [Amycolatopsis arida]SFO96598.1 DNA-binding transcriptional regulator YbjK [Amycolatopsis arida]
MDVVSGTASADGRRVRGERKRAAIIAATLRVVERDGVASVTHRSVAAEAGVSTGSASYYFATLDDLLVAALSAAAEDYDRQLRQLVASGCDELTAVTRLIAMSAGSGRTRALAERELNLLAARRPALRPVARRWRDMVAGVARGLTADELAVREVVAAADGMCTQLLLGEVELTEGEILAVLRRALRAG